MKLSIRDLDLRNRRVFIRVDFNVPIENGVVSDDTRIRASLPTIRYALEQGAAVLLASHLGRPKGQVNAKYSLKPVSSSLAALLGRPVEFATDCIGAPAKSVVDRTGPGGVVLLENLRFHPEEEKNDSGFAKQLAELAESVRERRVRRRASGPRVGRGDHPPRAESRGRAPDGKGARISRARAGVARTSARLDPRRRQGIGQARSHPELSRQGRSPGDRRRDGLHVPESERRSDRALAGRRRQARRRARDRSDHTVARAAIRTSDRSRRDTFARNRRQTSKRSTSAIRQSATAWESTSARKRSSTTPR